MIVDALILAAGSSSRLGQPKQALKVGRDTLLARAARRAAAAVSGQVHGVLGATAEANPPSVPGVQWHRFEGWSRGQHATLSFGLDRLGPVDGVLVTPCDQYRVTAAQLGELVALFCRSPQRPAAAAYAGGLGIPVVWPASWFDALRKAGRGQSLLKAGACSSMPLANAAFDVDTDADLAQMQRFCADAPGEDHG